MAKITANGAAEVCRASAKSRSGNKYIYVMCDDGRLLVRWDHPNEHFSIFMNGILPDNRTPFGLTGILARKGLREIRPLPSPEAE